MSIGDYKVSIADAIKYGVLIGGFVLQFWLMRDAVADLEKSNAELKERLEKLQDDIADEFRYFERHIK